MSKPTGGLLICQKDQGAEQQHLPFSLSIHELKFNESKIFTYLSAFHKIITQLK